MFWRRVRTPGDEDGMTLPDMWTLKRDCIAKWYCMDVGMYSRRGLVDEERYFRQGGGRTAYAESPPSAIGLSSAYGLTEK